MSLFARHRDTPFHGPRFYVRLCLLWLGRREAWPEVAFLREATCAGAPFYKRAASWLVGLCLRRRSWTCQRPAPDAPLCIFSGPARTACSARVRSCSPFCNGPFDPIEETRKSRCSAATWCVGAMLDPYPSLTSTKRLFAQRRCFALDVSSRSRSVEDPADSDTFGVQRCRVPGMRGVSGQSNPCVVIIGPRSLRVNATLHSVRSAASGGWDGRPNASAFNRGGRPQRRRLGK